MAVIKNVEKWKKEVEKALDSVFETKRISGMVKQEPTLFGKKTTFTLYLYLYLTGMILLNLFLLKIN